MKVKSKYVKKIKKNKKKNTFNILQKKVDKSGFQQQLTFITKSKIEKK